MTTLREELQKHKGELVKVGMASGFIYIHVVDETTEEDIKTINEAYRDNLRELVAKNKMLVETYESSFRNRVLRAQQAKRDGWVKQTYGKATKLSAESIQKYKQLLAKTPSEIEEHIADMRSKHLSRKRRYEWHLRNDIPMLDRDVLETYKSFEDKNVTIIIVEGVEEGAYWFPKEFDNAKASGRIVLRLFEEEENAVGEE